MAAPTPTVRGTPAGIKLKDGYSTKLTPALNTTISFWEKSLAMPGLDGGDPIDQVTMHNVAYRTMAPRALITLSPFDVKVAYDPNVINQIISLINRETTYTTTLPDGSTRAVRAMWRRCSGTPPTAGCLASRLRPATAVGRSSG